MAFELVVREAFDGFARGDRISDPEQIAAVLASEHEARVIRIAKEISAPRAADKVEGA
jgi:hypothetical protein